MDAQKNGNLIGVVRHGMRTRAKETHAYKNRSATWCKWNPQRPKIIVWWLRAPVHVRRNIVYSVFSLFVGEENHRSESDRTIGSQDLSSSTCLYWQIFPNCVCTRHKRKMCVGVCVRHVETIDSCRSVRRCAEQNWNKIIACWIFKRRNHNFVAPDPAFRAFRWGGTLQTNGVRMSPFEPNLLFNDIVVVRSVISAPAHHMTVTIHVFDRFIFADEYIGLTLVHFVVSIDLNRYHTDRSYGLYDTIINSSIDTHASMAIKYSRGSLRALELLLFIMFVWFDWFANRIYWRMKENPYAAILSKMESEKWQYEITRNRAKKRDGERARGIEMEKKMATEYPGKIRPRNQYFWCDMWEEYVEGSEWIGVKEADKFARANLHAPKQSNIQCHSWTLHNV